ncbi:MAG TPA: hypothetical protein VLA09_05005, partial [Longimicrobiales bacterium]|nr:hypothetical protein [Longimicrobiales bacterium]
MRELRDVLITYAAEDRERARPVVGRLREQGLCVAWDPQAPSARRRRVGRPREPVGCRPILVAQRGTTDGPGWVPVDAAEDEGRGYVVPVRLDDSNEVTAGRTAGPWVRGRPPSHPDFVEVV